MKELEIVSFEGLFTLLKVMPLNSTIDICDTWEEDEKNLQSEYVSGWYGIKKEHLFDADYDCVIIGWWGGGQETIIPLDDSFIEGFTFYVNNIMEGTTTDGRICIDFKSYKEAFKKEVDK